MKVTKTNLEGLLVVELDIFGDERGFFVERFNIDKFKELGLPCSFAQINHSRSAPGVLRGLHCQYLPPQGKLVGVTRGKILDVAVDIRHKSPTYGQHFTIELSDSNGKLLWMPAGFAHGFCVIGEELTDVLYLTDNVYSPGHEAGIMWNDPDIGINWPVKNPTISVRDQKMPGFKEYSAGEKFF